MKPLATILALLALALAGAAGMNPWPLLLAAVALAVRAVERVRTRNVNRLLTDVNLVPETVVATIYERSGRLVLRRRRA